MMRKIKRVITIVIVSIFVFLPIKVNAMSINIRDLTNNSTEFTVEPTDTVLQLKQQIQSIISIELDEILLLKNGYQLDDDTLTMSECGIQNNTTLDILYSLPISNNEFYVVMPDETTVTIDLMLVTTVMQLKQKVSTEKSIDVDKQILTFGGRTMDNSRNIADYGVVSGSRIQLTILYDVTIKTNEHATINVDKALAKKDEVVSLNITPHTGYRVKTINIINKLNDNNITQDVYNSVLSQITMPSNPIEIVVELEKIPYTIEITGEHITTSPTSPINVLYGDNKDVNISANIGYKIKSVKVDNVEQTIPLTNNRITLTGITKNTIISIEVEKIIYYFDEKSINVTFTKGIDKELSLKIGDTNIDNFDKVYINDVLLDQEFLEVSSGSIVVKIKDSYLKTLENGTYDIRVTTKDGGEANTTFVIANKVEVEKNPDTSDGIMNSLFLVSISIIGVSGCGLFLIEKKKYN